MRNLQPNMPLKRSNQTDYELKRHRKSIEKSETPISQYRLMKQKISNETVPSKRINKQLIRKSNNNSISRELTPTSRLIISKRMPLKSNFIFLSKTRLPLILLFLFLSLIAISLTIKHIEAQQVAGSEESAPLANINSPPEVEDLTRIRTSAAASSSSRQASNGNVFGGNTELETSGSYLVIGAEAINNRNIRLAAQLSRSSVPPMRFMRDDNNDNNPAPERELLSVAESTTSNSEQAILSPDEERDDFNLLSQPFDYHANMPVITKRELANAIKQATTNVKSLHDSLELASLPTGGGVLLLNEQQQQQQQTGMEVGSPAWLANSMFHRMGAPDLKLLNQTQQALISEETTRILAKQYKLNRIQILRGLPLISVEQTNLGKLCPRSSKVFNCLPGQYRSLSGHCNNVQNPDWAAAQTPLVRYAPARYADHVSRPIKSSSSTSNSRFSLPSSRAVSMAIYGALGEAASQNNEQPAGSNHQTGAGGNQHSHITTMMSFFGQFIFHDLSHISQFSGLERNSIKCCDDFDSTSLNNNNNNNARRTTNRKHPECMQIELKSSNYCLDYIRSTPAIRSGCNLGHRDQINLVTSFLDGSAIYGSSEEEARRLRTFTGGRLRSQRVPISGTSTNGNGNGNGNGNNQQFIELLPQIKILSNGSALDSVWSGAAEDCRFMAQMKKKSSGPLQEDSIASGRCFQAGDQRVNENIGLTLMHTIWLREHNLIADKLSQFNKHWRDEKLFEEARRIVIAQLQHITFNEFLPSILGDEIMQRFNLTTLGQGYSQNYDPQLNAGISNEVGTSILPFILSTIPTTLERYSDRLEMLGSTNVADTFMDGSDLFKKNRFGQYLMGMMSQNAMEPISGIIPMTMEMDSMLLSNNERPTMSRNSSPRAASRSSRRRRQLENNITIVEPPQVDIVALTIQQARDHGIKAYLYWRQVCQLKPTIRNWLDLAQVMPSNVVEKLKLTYNNVEQLDLYLAVLENPMPGATIGPTFVCLLARQFYHLKHGDRYWYENDFPQTAFAPKQLEQIRQTTLAKVLCRNSQSTINFIQPLPMITSDPYLNAYQYCTNKAMVEGLDVSKWRQPITSAQQLADEQFGNTDLESQEASLSRGKRLIRENVQLISRSFNRAKRDLDKLAYREIVKLRRFKRSQAVLNNNNNNNHNMMAGRGGGNHAAGYRYLPRMKRQTLKINNQSLIFELATNEVVRSLIRQGKDREQANSLQNDVRDFLLSLESIQLDNLIANSDESNRLSEFISMAGGNFLTQEQRNGLIQLGDRSLLFDPVLDSGAQLETTARTSEMATRSSSVSANCQDDDRTFPCDHTTPFRTITGWCNNLNNPKFGQSFTPHDRILPNAYEDGLSLPRQFSVFVSNQQTGDKLPLPSARLISTTIHDDRSQLHVRYSLALMQFGQFGVDHDLTRTPFSVALDGSLLDCSPCDSKRTVHRDCLPIEIPAEDSFFNSQKAKELTGTSARKCLHFVRSLNGQTGLGPRQQLNALTAYIDGSNIYGSDNCEAKSLRSFVGGRLNSSSYAQTAMGNTLLFSQKVLNDAREILPITRANPECVTPAGVCFHAGDQRASEQPGLTAIHTVFMRLHNTIVNQLSQINRHWNDEKLYQQGRRIVGAIMQRITYNEFAPRLLGLDYMSKFDLILKQVGYSNHYDDSCSANILNEFAAAAFRMGHSLIRNAFPLLNKQYKQIGKAFQLRKAFFNSQRILTEPNLIDSILRGIVSTPIETLDNSITEELTNHLFEKPKEPFSGMDLISLNIQRARDHGVASYNKYRLKCNLTKAKTFDDLSGEIPIKLVKRLAQLYASVDDIDLFTGGMSELPVHGGIIGPTLGCIIGMQFSRLKRCDRFWHETNDPWVRFSLPQLAEIRKMTLAKVICQESDNIDTIQRNAMDISDQYLNPRVACSSLPTMDLSVWRENTKSCLVNKIKFELGQSKRVNPCKSCTCTLEGPVCRTAKINCLKAIKQPNSLNQIMADKSCLVQCAWTLDMQPAAN